MERRHLLTCGILWSFFGSRNGEYRRCMRPAAAQKAFLWRQIQADIFHAPVMTMNVEESPAAGSGQSRRRGEAGVFRNILVRVKRLHGWVTDDGTHREPCKNL